MCNLVEFKRKDAFADFTDKLKKVLGSITLNAWIERYTDDIQKTFSADEKAMSLEKYLSTVNDGKMNELPITAEFCINYKQKQNGYIKNAKNANPKINNPNQYWHIFYSWITLFSDPKRTIGEGYSRLLCPELVLGIAEMAGVDVKLLNRASSRAQNLLEDGFCRSCACKKIKEMIPFEKIIEALNKCVTKYNIH